MTEGWGGLTILAGRREGALAEIRSHHELQAQASEIVSGRMPSLQAS